MAHTPVNTQMLATVNPFAGRPIASYRDIVAHIKLMNAAPKVHTRRNSVFYNNCKIGCRLSHHNTDQTGIAAELTKTAISQDIAAE